MPLKHKTAGYILLQVILWGSLWGIFEATVGYLLHMVSFGYSWLVWFPFACFFFENVYRKTEKVSAVFVMGQFCACIKLLNLFLPGRTDRVLNPAISIVFESLAAAAVLYTVNHFVKEKPKKPLVKALSVLVMNTGWRALFAMYLYFLVPNWMFEVSVVSSPETFLPFFVTQNLITSAILYIPYQYDKVVLFPVIWSEKKIASLVNAMPKRAVPVLHVCFATMLFGLYVSLLFLLS